MTRFAFVFSVAAALVLAASPAGAQEPADNMSFFITSAGPGNGANLGGLAGADAHCEMLAEAAGAGDRTWRAYLSTSGADTVNARDRIGSGPWFNFAGVQVAANVADLHSEDTNLGAETVLTETGETPQRHDVLTGSNMDGTALSGDPATTTCGNWTSGADGEGSAQLGHFDRQGGGQNPNSWNSAHASRGCSQPNLVATSGDGLFYCFATD
jgi:hypothetical protein